MAITFKDAFRDVGKDLLKDYKPWTNEMDPILREWVLASVQWWRERRELQQSLWEHERQRPAQPEALKGACYPNMVVIEGQAYEDRARTAPDSHHWQERDKPDWQPMYAKSL